MVNGSSLVLSQIDGVTSRADIKRIWTLYDEKQVVENAPFNPFTGNEVTSPLDAVLEHHKGVFLEDYVHDWNIRNDELHMYSRATGLHKPITLLIELNEKINEKK